MPISEGPCCESISREAINTVAGLTGSDMKICKAGDPTVLDSLREKRALMASKLADIDAAIEVFEKNPELQKALTVLGKVGRW